MKAVRRVPNPDRDERQSCHDVPRANWPIQRKELYSWQAVAFEDANWPFANFPSNAPSQLAGQSPVRAPRGTLVTI